MRFRRTELSRAPELWAGDLFAAGDVLGAARREADACERDGYSGTAAILRKLVEMYSALESQESRRA